MLTRQGNVAMYKGAIKEIIEPKHGITLMDDTELVVKTGEVLYNDDLAPATVFWSEEGTLPLQKVAEFLVDNVGRYDKIAIDLK